MTSKHSPGPWSFQDHGSLILDARSGSSQTLVAKVEVNTYRDEGRYNARLIAAAPELLQTLQMVESVYRKNCVTEGEPSSVLDAIQAAIAKATGEA